MLRENPPSQNPKGKVPNEKICNLDVSWRKQVWTSCTISTSQDVKLRIYNYMWFSGTQIVALCGFACYGIYLYIFIYLLACHAVFSWLYLQGNISSCSLFILVGACASLGYHGSASEKFMVQRSLKNCHIHVLHDFFITKMEKKQNSGFSGHFPAVLGRMPSTHVFCLGLGEGYRHCKQHLPLGPVPGGFGLLELRYSLEARWDGTTASAKLFWMSEIYWNLVFVDPFLFWVQLCSVQVFEFQC